MRRRDLHHRRVLVTGASRGLGRALALKLAPFATKLLIVARSAEALDALAEELRQKGAAEVLPTAGDVTDADFRRQLTDQVRQHWHALDILVNNAGVSAHGHFQNHDEQLLRRIMELNFFAPAELTRECLPLLQQGDEPTIVNIGSILGHRGVPHNSEYSASKFALRGWSEAVRAELHAAGIHLLLVSPGTVDTQFFDHLMAKSDSLPWGPQRGISPQAAAAQIVRAIERRKNEIFPNWRGRLLVMLNREAPWIVDRVMNRYG